jgi:hypothetical protein
MPQVDFAETSVRFTSLEELSRDELDFLYRNHTLRGSMMDSCMKEIISNERYNRSRRKSVPRDRHLIAILYDSEGTIMGWGLSESVLRREDRRSPYLQVFVQRRFRRQLHGGRLLYLFARELKRRYGMSSYRVYNDKIEGSIQKYQDRYVRKDRRIEFSQAW